MTEVPQMQFMPTTRDFAGISLANNKQLDDKTFQLAPYYYIEALQGGFDYTGEGGSILITLP